MGLLDLFFSSVGGVCGAICCPGDNIDAMEQAIMNDAKSENEDIVKNDTETNNHTEINKSEEI